ncbi:MAG: DUF177 domain-containing protein [Methylocella sp.]
MSASIEPGPVFLHDPLAGVDALMLRNHGVAMTSSTVPAPRSRKPGPAKTGAKSGAAKFMRMLVVETVPDTGLDIRLCANETECAALAGGYGLVAVQTFEADFHVRKQGPKGYKVSGVLHALVTQTCVVSLEPFETLVSAPVDVDFAPSPQALGERASQKVAAGGPAATFAGPQDPPDPILNGQIDLGALAAEFLALNLDLYPRKPGVTFENMYVGGEASGTDSPFAVLRHRS